MVLYKRKRVSFMKPPDLPSNLNQEVYYIPATMEWFFNYEEYLERMDYYNRRKFVCEITGNSCLTYFEALNSEEKEIKGVEKNFPEALREHILRFLQFNRITRLDQLVDKVYLVFKNDYFPGENIYIRGMNNTEDSYDAQNAPKQRGTIREKVQYGQSDSVTTKYLVVRLSDMQQAIVTKEKISRDRNHFTKWLIKTFIKLTMSRSHKVGAPWVVKDKFAKKYRISQEYPDDLKHFAYSTPTGEALYEDSDQGGSPAPSLNETKTKRQKKTPGPKGAKGKSVLNNLIDVDDSVSESSLEERFVSHADLKKRFQNHHLPDRIQSEVDAISGVSTPLNQLSSQSSLQPTKKNIVDDLCIKFDIQNTKPQPKRLELDYFNSLPSDESDNEMSDDEPIENIEPIVSVRFDSIQEGLQTWTFLNIYHNALKLDTFTFDDFICAMNWNKIQFDKIGRCELLDEIWCAVLSAFVSNEIPSSSEEKESESNDEVYGLLISIPNVPKNELDGSMSSNGKAYLNGSQDLKHENSDDENIDFDEEEKNNGNTRSETETAPEIKNEQNIKDEDNESMDVDTSNNSVEEKNEDEQEMHNAYNVMNYRNITWHERLRKRNFKDGNWQCILLGVLSLVEHMPCYNELIESIYVKLAPMESPPTPSTVLNQFYEAVNINLRLKILNLLIELLMNGNLVRSYIDECLEESTNLRRERLDCIREIKSLIETAQKQNAIISEITNGASNKDKSDLTNKRLRLNFKIMELNQEEQELWNKSEDYKNAWNLRKESLIKIEEFNHTKKELEKKLNELDCQRVKLLGKDRLYNRYWWFENNGLPTLHGSSNDDEDDNEDEGEKNEESNAQDDSEDILDETYLMGKLWVQGPSSDDMRIHLKAKVNEMEDFSNVIKNNDVNFSVVREGDNGEANEECSEKINTIKELNFNQIPDYYKEAMRRELGLYVYSDKICVSNPQTNGQEELIDKFGGLLDPLSFQYLRPLQRKVIEELPDPLVDGTSWRYYDSPDEINKLIEWLNPWGKRESQLRKELINAKDAIIKNMNARSKAFSSMKEEEKEKELSAHLTQIVSRIDQLESGDSDHQENADTSEPDQNSKRSLRSDLSARKKQKPSDKLDILKLMSVVDLKRMQFEVESKLSFEKRKKTLLKVLEWINSKAIDLYDKSLYEGGDKAKGRASRRAKNIK